MSSVRVYRTIENIRVRKLVIIITVLAGVLFLSAVILRLRGDIGSLSPYIFFLYCCSWLLFKLQQKYTVDEEEQTVKLPAVKTPVDIQSIKQIVISKSKKGRIKKMTLRVPPYRYYVVEPANKEAFISHLSKMNSNIEIFVK